LEIPGERRHTKYSGDTVRADMMVGLIGMAPSVQRTVTKPWAQQLQGLGFNSQQWQIPLFSLASRLALQPT